jgi:hypothetical protein
MQATKAAFDKYVKIIKKEYAMIGMKRVMSNLAIKLMEATKAAFDKCVKIIKKEYAMIGMKRVMSKIKTTKGASAMSKTKSLVSQLVNSGGGGG